MRTIKNSSPAKIKAAAKAVKAARLAAMKVAEEEEKLRLIKAVEMGVRIASQQQQLHQHQQRQQHPQQEQQRQHRQHRQQGLEAVAGEDTNNASFPIAFVDVLSEPTKEMNKEDNLYYGSLGIGTTTEDEFGDGTGNNNNKNGGVAVVASEEVHNNADEWNNLLLGRGMCGAGACFGGGGESVLDFSLPWSSASYGSQGSYSGNSDDDSYSDHGKKVVVDQVIHDNIRGGIKTDKKKKNRQRRMSAIHDARAMSIGSYEPTPGPLLYTSANNNNNNIDNKKKKTKDKNMVKREEQRKKETKKKKKRTKKTNRLDHQSTTEQEVSLLRSRVSKTGKVHEREVNKLKNELTMTLAGTSASCGVINSNAVSSFMCI